MSRLLDSRYDPVLRANVVPLTVTRIAANTCYRFAPPFIAIIAGKAQGFDVSIAQVGLVISISELAGFLAPLLGTLVDRVSRLSSMTIGLVGTCVGILLMAGAPNLVVLCIGLTLLNLLKSCFDLGMAAWIADRVPYEQRGRVVGITETSWAISLLGGVLVLGLITAATSWRVACVAGGAFVATCGLWLFRRIQPAGEAGSRESVRTSERGRMPRRAWFVPLSMFGLMGASQSLFVTFGAWLADDFQFGATGIAVVGFALGAGELLSSMGSARYTDRLGKERSVVLGVALMVPSAVVLAAFNSTLGVGLLALAIFIIGFEYGVVSMLPLATNLVAASPGKGLGLVIGAGTFGRGVLTFVATVLYERVGIAGAALAAIVCSLLCAGSIAAFNRGSGA